MKTPMYTKAIIVFYSLILILMCFNSVYGLSDSDITEYWSFNNTLVGEVNGYTLNNSGTAYTSSGYFGGAYDYELSELDYLIGGDRDYYSFTDGSGNDEAFSVSMWVKWETLTDYQILYSKSTASASEYVLQSSASGLLYFGLYTTSTDYLLKYSDSSVLTAGVWHNVVTTYDGSETLSGISIYVDGSEITTTSATGGTYTGMPNGAGVFALGRKYTSPPYYFDGILDEFYIFNKELNSTEVLELSNNVTYPFTTTFTPTIEILNLTVNDETFVNDTVFDINNLIINNTYQVIVNETYNYTNSSITTLNNLDNGIYYFEEEVCYNTTCTSTGNYTFTINVSTSFTTNFQNIYNTSTFSTTLSTTELFDSIIGTIYVNGTTQQVGSDITYCSFTGTSCSINTNFTKTIPLNTPFSTNTYLISIKGFVIGIGLVETLNITFKVDINKPIINHNIPIEINNYNLTNININVTDTNPSSCIINIDSTNYTCSSFTGYNFSTNGYKDWTITATDLAGNQATETGTLLVNPPQYFYFQYSNGTSITDFTLDGNNYTNYATIYAYNNGLIIGSNNIIFEKLGFANTNISFTLTDTSTLNITTNISTSKILINIYDRTTGILINETVSLTLIGTYGINSTTNNGTLKISNILLLDEDYQIIASSSNYVSESVYFSFTNREISIVDIYMIKSNLTNYGTHTVKAITDTGLLVNNAVCKALEWKPTLSAFVSVAQGTTDSTGEVLLNVELGTKLYKFQCTKGTATAYSSNKIISTSGTSTTIQLATTIITPSNIFEGITYILTNTSINSTHQRITYTWSDSNGLVDIGCLKIYKVVGTKFIELQSSCVSSSSSNIQLIQNINQTYTIRAIGSINVDGVVTDLDYIEYQPIDSIGKALKEYGLDIIIPLVFIIIGFSIGFLLSPQNIYISIISTIVMVWLSVIMVPSLISSVIASFVTIICGLMLWGGYKYK